MTPSSIDKEPQLTTEQAEALQMTKVATIAFVFTFVTLGHAG